MAAPLIAVGGILLRLGLAALGVGGTAYGLKKMHDVGEEKMFNKGICPTCHGHFEFKTEVGYSRAYKCDFCNNSILVSNDKIDKDYKYTPSEISKK
jgi:hypothetical protein